MNQRVSLSSIATLQPHEQHNEQREVVLSWGSCHLLLPSEDVLSLETPLDLKTDLKTPSSPTNAAAQSIGHLPWREYKVPVFCFSDNFRLLRQAPQTRRLCALLQGQDRQPLFALLCEHIHFISNDASMLTLEIPTCMTTEIMAFERLGFQDEQLFYRSTTSTLNTYLYHSQSL